MNLRELWGVAYMWISSSIWRSLKFWSNEDTLFYPYVEIYPFSKFLGKGSFMDIFKLVANNFCSKNKEASSQRARFSSQFSISKS